MIGLKLLFLVIGITVLLSIAICIVTILVLKNSTFRELKKEVKNGETFIDKAWLKNDKKGKMKKYLEAHGYKYGEQEHPHEVIGVGKINYFDGTEKYEIFTSKIHFAECNKQQYQQAKKGEFGTVTFEDETTKGWFLTEK